jgi:hypothetical protein
LIINEQYREKYSGIEGGPGSDTGESENLSSVKTHLENDRPEADEIELEVPEYAINPDGQIYPAAGEGDLDTGDDSYIRTDDELFDGFA